MIIGQKYFRIVYSEMSQIAISIYKIALLIQNEHMLVLVISRDDSPMLMVRGRVQSLYFSDFFK